MWRIQYLSALAAILVCSFVLAVTTVCAQAADISSSPPPSSAPAPSAAPAPEIIAPVSPTSPPSLIYDYSDGPKGPVHWGDIRDDWILCKEGTAQSPLRITPNIIITDPTLGELDASYVNLINATIRNNGRAVEVELGQDTGILNIYNVAYKPKQFHFHSPSEHRILDYRFPLEMHLVHQSADNKTAVISILFYYGAENPFLSQFFGKLPLVANQGDTAQIGLMELFGKKLKLGRTYGRYRGSITTPPCTEKVIWTVMLWDWPTISDQQIQQLKDIFPEDNARTPSFPSHGRKFRINHIHALRALSENVVKDKAV